MRWLESPSTAAVKIKGGWSRRFSPHATREVGRARDQSINTARNVGTVLRKWLLKPCEKQGVGRGEHRCIVRQVQNARNLQRVQMRLFFGTQPSKVSPSVVSTGSRSTPARAAFKLRRGHNGTLAMLAPWHASSNIDIAFRLRSHGSWHGVKECGRVTQTWRRRRQLPKENRDGWRC